MVLPLSAGDMVMLFFLLRYVTAFFSCIVSLDGGTFALERVAEAFVLILSAFDCVTLLIHLTVSVVVCHYGQMLRRRGKPLGTSLLCLHLKVKWTWFI